MKHQRSHGVTGVTWFCEVPPSPTSLISIYPHPIRLVTPPPQPLPCIRRSSPTPVLSSDSSQFFPQTLPSSSLRLSPVLSSDSPHYTGPWEVSPRGRGRRGGGRNPLPCLYFQYAHIPHPARPLASSPAPPGAGAVVAIPGERPYPGRIPITPDRGRRGRNPPPCLCFQHAGISSPAPVLSSDSPHYTGPWEVSPRGSKND
jgi:hypothetical protein